MERVNELDGEMKIDNLVENPSRVARSVNLGGLSSDRQRRFTARNRIKTD